MLSKTHIHWTARQHSRDIPFSKFLSEAHCSNQSENLNDFCLISLAASYYNFTTKNLKAWAEQSREKECRVDWLQHSFPKYHIICLFSEWFTLVTCGRPTEKCLGNVDLWEDREAESPKYRKLLWFINCVDSTTLLFTQKSNDLLLWDRSFWNLVGSSNACCGSHPHSTSYKNLMQMLVLNRVCAPLATEQSK